MQAILLAIQIQADTILAHQIVVQAAWELNSSCNVSCMPFVAITICVLRCCITWQVGRGYLCWGLFLRQQVTEELLQGLGSSLIG